MLCFCAKTAVVFIFLGNKIILKRNCTYLLRSQWTAFSTLKSSQNPSYMLAPIILLNARTFVLLRCFPTETFRSLQLPEG